MRTLALALLTLLALPAAAEQPSDYASGLPLTVTPGQPFQRVELPLAVYAQARPDLADLRVFNAAGEALPHAFASGGTLPQPSAPVAVPRFPLRAPPGSDNRLEVRVDADGSLISLRRQAPAPEAAVAWLFDLSAVREPVQALLLEWPANAEGISASVRLEGSDDLNGWSHVASSALLDLRFDGEQLRQKRIAFPATRYRYLRLASNRPLPALTGAAVEGLPTPAVLPERWLDVKGHPGDTPGDYEFDLGARLVATRVGLHLPQANMVVPVEWQVRERQREEWRSVLRTTAWRLQREGADLDSAAVETGAVPGRYWRLRVDPRAGTLGGEAPVLRLWWRPAQLVFVARGKPPFILAYGRRDATPAQLPIASLVPGYRPGMEAALPLVETGRPLALGGRNAPAPGQEDRPPPDRKRWLLWGILLLGVGILAFMAYSLLRTPRPD